MYSDLLVLDFAHQNILKLNLSTVEVVPVVSKTGWCPDGITFAGDALYWTCMGKPTPDAHSGEGFSFAARNGAIATATPSAQSVVVRSIISSDSGIITTAKQLTFDGDNSLYWSDREGCKVCRCSLDGTQIQELIVREPEDSELNQCVGIAVDTANGYFYWSQKGPAKGGQGRIFRARIDYDGNPTQRSDIELLWDNLPEPIDLEIHDGFLYWTDRGQEPYGNTLNRAPLPKNGERGACVQVLAGGFKEAIGVTIDGEKNTAYVTDLSGKIYACELTNCPDYSPTEQQVSVSAGLWGAQCIYDVGSPLTGICGKTIK